MRFVSFETDGQIHAGIMTEEGIVPITALDPALPDDVAAIVRQGARALDGIASAMDAAVGARRFDPGQVTLKAPLIPARNVFCIGKNYLDHAKEFEGSGFDASSRGQEVPDVPIVFTKAPTSVTGPYDPIDSSLDPTGTLDYEGELAVVIGEGGRGITAAEAMSHVWGYTVVNDVTARETQNRHRQWFLGKSPDTFCPMGPALVTADEVGEVATLRLTTRVNGELRQDAVVRDLIFDIPTIIETISAAITLVPGDVIATGTPAGVAIGFNPPKYLKQGDVVEVSIDRIGAIVNRIA
jgi:2-keto-4-pentenoate hydratase/2-oxohepta-3-ene-1,7-dioic acid hydratase in catechol pathway